LDTIAVEGVGFRAVPRSDGCGNAIGLTCESLVGNVVTDAMRAAYLTDFAITNSGGLRADLTCPVTDQADDFCAAFTPPPYPITRGQVLAVLPFGNIVATLPVNGAELKSMLEKVSPRCLRCTGASTRVGPVLHLRHRRGGRERRHRSRAPGGDGSGTGPLVDLTDPTTYAIATNDFVANGGDGHPNFASRIVTQDFMDEVTADYVEAAARLRRSRHRSRGTSPASMRPARSSRRTKPGGGGGAARPSRPTPPRPPSA
jgi:2',3'-cyclic-nucleotide 2'-phosphodiesterase (5'-nucleotidase family)